MKKTLLYLVLFLVALSLIAPVASARWGWKWRCPTDKVKVMTRNLYLGADIFKVLEAAQNPDQSPDGLDIPRAVEELYKTVQYTNFPERAQALANEIYFLRPHLIGLQEVSLWYIQRPGDMILGGTAPATTVDYDFLEILLAALEARGLNYHVAVESTGNADVELPMIDMESPIGFSDLRLVDRDVILVRGDVDFWNPAMASYANNIIAPIGNVALEFTRGWVAVDADVNGEVYRFVNTHLEVRSSPYSIFRVIQSAQMQELLTILDYEPKQVILVGDFNSSPEDVPGLGYLPKDLDEDGLPLLGAVGTPYVPPYMLAMDYFGYLDAWDLLYWRRDGFTDGFSETIDDPHDRLTSRIDLILLSPVKEVQSVFGIRTGAHRFSMTPSGLWPSDHAGVFTRIVFKD